MGINDLRVIDFDGVEDKIIIEKFLNELGLPKDYCWAVQSGSGAGFHIYIKSPSPTLPEGKGVIEKIGGLKAAYKFKIKGRRILQTY